MIDIWTTDHDDDVADVADVADDDDDKWKKKKRLRKDLCIQAIHGINTEIRTMRTEYNKW